MANPGLNTDSAISLYGINLWDEDTIEHYASFGKSYAIRTIVCNWADRNIMINNIGGFSGFNLYNQFYYSPASPYPAAPTLLYFSNIDVEGVGVRSDDFYQGGGELVGYQWARCKIHYESLPWPPLQPGILSVDYAIDYITYPQPIGSSLDNNTGAYLVDVMGTPTPLWKFKTTGNPVGYGQMPGIPNMVVNCSWTTFNNLSLPIATIDSYAGGVNSTEFLGSAKGTVYFQGTQSIRQLNTQGVESWTITYPYIYNAAGWNSLYNPKTQLFEEIEDISGNPRYPYVDFNALTPGITF